MQRNYFEFLGTQFLSHARSEQFTSGQNDLYTPKLTHHIREVIPTHLLQETNNIHRKVLHN